MNEQSLSRTLATNVVDALKAHGHILIVKGGSAALVRELEELIEPRVKDLVPRIQPFATVGGEVTSTFGSDAADETVEELVVQLTHALMDSEHVEDVFAEDNVIRRDVFRVIRDGLIAGARTAEGEAEEEAQLKIRLDTLGYVAATVSKRADAPTLREAFERAGDTAQATFVTYNVDVREAVFTLEADDPDARLDLEEAIADELTDLVRAGLVELPAVERKVDLGRALGPSEQRAARAIFEAAAHRTLLRAGLANWELEDGRALKVTFTPLSEQDARAVDQHVAAFGRDVLAALAEPKAAPGSQRTPIDAAPAKAAPALAEADEDEIEDELEEDEVEEEAETAIGLDEDELEEEAEEEPEEEAEEEAEEPIEAEEAEEEAKEAEEAPRKPAKKAAAKTAKKAAKPAKKTTAKKAAKKATTTAKKAAPAKKVAKKAAASTKKTASTKAAAKKR